MAPISEQAFAELKTKIAIAETNQAGIERRLANIEATLNRIMWIVVSGILIAILGYLIKGGFYVPGN